MVRSGRTIAFQHSADDGGIEIPREWTLSRKDLRCDDKRPSEITRKSNSHLPGEHPECIHVTGFRNSGRGFSRSTRARQFWSAAAVEADGVPLWPQIRTGYHEGRIEACDARGAIGTNQDVLLRDCEPTVVLEVRDRGSYRSETAMDDSPIVHVIQPAGDS